MGVEWPLLPVLRARCAPARQPLGGIARPEAGHTCTILHPLGKARKLQPGKVDGIPSELPCNYPHCLWDVGLGVAPPARRSVVNRGERCRTIRLADEVHSNRTWPLESPVCAVVAPKGMVDKVDTGAKREVEGYDLRSFTGCDAGPRGPASGDHHGRAGPAWPRAGPWKGGDRIARLHVRRAAGWREVVQGGT